MRSKSEHKKTKSRLSAILVNRNEAAQRMNERSPVGFFHEQRSVAASTPDCLIAPM